MIVWRYGSRTAPSGSPVPSPLGCVRSANHSLSVRIMPRAHSLPILIATLAVSACGGSDSAELMLHPQLVLVDSIVLEQGDSTFLARPSAVAVDDDGYWVADMQQATLSRYDREGRYERRVGRQGRGPGEFGAPFRLASSATGRLDVADLDGFSVTRVNADNGAHLYRHSLGSQMFITSMAYRGDSLLLGGASLQPLAGAVWLSMTTGEFTAAVPTSEANRGLLMSFEFATAAEVRDGVIATWQGLHHARLRGWDGSETDLAIPARDRNVPPLDLMEQLISRRLDGDSARALYPLPVAAGTLSNGDAAIMHVQARWSADRRGAVWERGFLSVINAAADSACVDAPIEFRSDELPVVAFHGDTLFFLDQVVQDTDAIAVVRSFEISTAGCEWLPITRHPTGDATP